MLYDFTSTLHNVPQFKKLNQWTIRLVNILHSAFQANVFNIRAIYLPTNPSMRMTNSNSE